MSKNPELSMPTKSKREIRAEDDLEVVKKQLGDGTLEKSFAKLDPKNVRKTLQLVPPEPIRLLMAMLAVPENERKIAALKDDLRKPLEQFVEVGRRHKGEEFVRALLREIERDDTIGNRLGIRSSGFSITQREADIYNTITRVSSIPQLMLKSRRVYSEIGFFQEDKLLFRSTMELDDMLRVASDLLGAVDGTLGLLKNGGKALAPRIPLQRCQDQLKEIKEHLGKIGPVMAKIAKRS